MSQFAQAKDLILLLGYRDNIGDNTAWSPPANYSGAPSPTGEAGLLLGFNFGKSFIRTGLMAAQRTYNVTSGNLSAFAGYTMTTMELPLWVGFWVGPLEIYGGADFGTKLSSSSTAGNGGSWAATETFTDSGPIMAPRVGIGANLAKYMRAEAFFETTTQISYAQSTGSAQIPMRGFCAGGDLSFFY